MNVHADLNFPWAHMSEDTFSKFSLKMFLGLAQALVMSTHIMFLWRNKKNIYLDTYRNNPKYWDRQAFANSVDPDQIWQNTASDQGYTICHTYSNVLEASRGSRMDYFKFYDMYGK